MSTRQEPIVKTALLGTERRPLTAADLAGIGATPGAAEPAQTALEALVTLYLRRKAGFLLADAPPDRPAPAPIDERPVCGPAAVRVLQQLLGGQHLPALPELVDLLDKSGQRLPPENLPDILHKCLENRLLFAHFEPLLGPVGHWLARQHFRWQALLPDPQAEWFTASLDDRLRLLHTMRRRSPLAALAWLEATWAQENSLHQVEFLEILIVGLSTFDEPLLQRAAADKKEKVSSTAQRLLDLLSLSPAERLQLATAHPPNAFPAAVPRERWPKPARLALLSAAVWPVDLLTGAWSRLLLQLTSSDRINPGFFEAEEMARIIAYQGELSGLEAAFQIQSDQLPPETKQLLANVLAFRRQLLSALIG